MPLFKCDHITVFTKKTKNTTILHKYSTNQCVFFLNLLEPYHLDELIIFIIWIYIKMFFGHYELLIISTWR